MEPLVVECGNAFTYYLLVLIADLYLCVLLSYNNSKLRPCAKGFKHLFPGQQNEHSDDLIKPLLSVHQCLSLLRHLSCLFVCVCVNNLHLNA